MKSFVKSYPDIIGYVERRSRAPTAMAPNSGREGLGDPCSVAFFAGHRVAMVQLKQEMPGTVDETKRSVAFMRQLAREVRGDQPAMSIEEHLAAYGAVEPREAREPSGRGGSRNATYGQTSHRQTASCTTTSTSDHGGRK